MKKLACLGLVLGLHVTAAWTASELEPPALDQYLRWGVLRVRPGFELSDVGYDDNILYNDNNKVSDYTATVSPKVEGLLLLGSRAFFQFEQRFDFTFYRENTDQNFDNSYTATRFTYPLRKIGFFTDLGYDRANLRPVDLEQVRVERKRKELAAGVILNLGWRTEVEIGRTQTDLSYDDPAFALRQDRQERGTSVEASYRVLGQSRILLSALNKTVDFDNAFVSGDLVVFRDTRERRLLGGLALGEGGRLTGSFQLGWAEIDAEDPLLTDLSELVGEAELAYRLGTRTKMQLTALRIPGYAVFQANSYYLDTTVGLRAVHYLNRLLGVEAGGRIGRLTFPSSFIGTDREDDLARYEVGVRVRISENALGRRVEYRLRIGKHRRTSTVEAQNQTRNTISFGAVVGF